MKIKVYPIANGNHNNLHMIAKVNNLFKFKINVFLDNCDAYIMNFSSKIPIEFLDKNNIYQFLNEGLIKWDYKLKTNSKDIFISKFENTDELIKYLKNDDV